jgi:hypothetical protein
MPAHIRYSFVFEPAHVPQRRTPLSRQQWWQQQPQEQEQQWRQRR